jgi:hypothetical protein
MTNNSSLDNQQDFKSIAKQLHQNFNNLSESKLNPLLTGIFLVGMAMSLFDPGIVAYLTIIFGASSGLAYAASKNKVGHNLPNWAFPVIGVSAALIYVVSGIPGLILTSGISGGWYLHSQFKDRFEDWKSKARNFATEFKANPFQAATKTIFKTLQFLSDFIISIETPKENKDITQNGIRIIYEGDETVAIEQITEPEIIQAEQQASTSPEPINLDGDPAKPIEPVIEISRTPEPVLFSSAATARTIPETEAQPAPFIPQASAPVLKTPEPKTQDTINIMGYPILTFQKRKIIIDSKSHTGIWGAAKLFLDTLDPRADIIVRRSGSRPPNS